MTDIHPLQLFICELFFKNPDDRSFNDNNNRKKKLKIYLKDNYIPKFEKMELLVGKNKIVSKDYQNIADEMFQVTTFADNINDGFTKNILKLLLGYIIRVKSKKSARAIDIYNEDKDASTYFYVTGYR